MLNNGSLWDPSLTICFLHYLKDLAGGNLVPIEGLNSPLFALEVYGFRLNFFTLAHYCCIFLNLRIMTDKSRES